MTEKDRLIRECRTHIACCPTCSTIRTTELLCPVGHGLWLASLEPPTYDLCGADECGAPRPTDDRHTGEWDDEALDRLWHDMVPQHRPTLASFVVLEDMWRLEG